MELRPMNYNRFSDIAIDRYTFETLKSVAGSQPFMPDHLHMPFLLKIWPHLQETAAGRESHMLGDPQMPVFPATSYSDFSMRGALSDAGIDTGSSVTGYTIDTLGATYLTAESDHITNRGDTAVTIDTDWTNYYVDGLVGARTLDGRGLAKTGIDYGVNFGTIFLQGHVMASENAIQQSSFYTGNRMTSVYNDGAILSFSGSGVAAALNKTLVLNTGLILARENGVRLVQDDAGSMYEFSSGVYNFGQLIADGTAIYVKNRTEAASQVTIHNVAREGVDVSIQTKNPDSAHAVLIDDETTYVELRNEFGAEIIGDIALTGSGGFVKNFSGIIYGDITIGRVGEVNTDQIFLNGGSGGYVEGSVTMYGRDNSLVFWDDSITKSDFESVAQGDTRFEVGCLSKIVGDMTLASDTFDAQIEGSIIGDLMLISKGVGCFKNSGYIDGCVSWTASGNDSTGTFSNAGKIAGDVKFVAISLDAENEGTIVGDVYLGTGNVVFSNYNGTVSCVTYAVGGVNEYYSGFDSDTFVSGDGKDSFFVLWNGPWDGRKPQLGDDLKTSNNGHDIFERYSPRDEFSFVYDGNVYEAAGILDAFELKNDFKAAGGDACFCLETLTLSFFYDGGGQFDVMFDENYRDEVNCYLLEMPSDDFAAM